MKLFDPSLFIYVIIVFFGWGISVFTDKLAANSLGSKGTMLYVVSFIPSLLVLLIVLLMGNKTGYQKDGVLWLIASTIFNIVALAAYYVLFTKTQASWASAITALYPVCTILLAFIFLHEKLSFYNLIGIVFALLAVVFLSI